MPPAPSAPEGREDKLFTFDGYLRYDDLTSALRRLAGEYPELCELSSIGRSHEGRDVWMMTVTNTKTGPAADKPAMYVDGNMHAGEVTGSMVCLYGLHHLLSRYGSDEQVTWLLDTRAFYVAPRVNPDGAEKYLTTPYMLRSSVRPYPDEAAADCPGLHAEDIDGDGFIRLMRVRDDARGEWKVSSRDPRLMIARGIDDRGGPFYHVYQEGLIREFEGEPFRIAPTPWGLDMNRNFPSNWSPGLRGGGPYPASEPEVKNIVEFILAHPNVGALQAFHTSGGILFRGPYVYPDEQMDREDYHTLIDIASRGTELTGYPDVSSYSGPYAATIVDWAYEHRGILGFTTELWDMWGRAGIKRDWGARGPRPPGRDDLEETGLKLLRWNDLELAGEGFMPWRRVEHPQLGEVEVGGWDPKFARQNPPPKMLRQECHKNFLFCLAHCAALPKVEVRKLTASAAGAGIYRIDALIENTGYLPTNITNKGIAVKASPPVKARLQLPKGHEFLHGGAEQEIGHLEGYRQGQDFSPWGAARPARSAARLSWVVKRQVDAEAKPGGAGRRATLLVLGGRGGQATAGVDIGE